jgi:hypothetical protein
LNIILFLTVSFNIHAFCGTYANEPFIFIFFPVRLFNTSKLFNIAFKRQVFPAPTGPTIPIKSPFSTFKLISDNNLIISISGISSFFLSLLLFSLSLINLSLSLSSFSIIISFCSLSSLVDNFSIFSLSSFSNNFSFFSLSISSLLLKFKSCNSIPFSSSESLLDSSM